MRETGRRISKRLGAWLLSWFSSAPPTADSGNALNAERRGESRIPRIDAYAIAEYQEAKLVTFVGERPVDGS